jgi:glucuronoarabinoxylan endo-1,4-beta-xylanase
MKRHGLCVRQSFVGRLSTPLLRLVLLGVCACSSEGSPGANEALARVAQAIEPQAGDVVVTWADEHQTITGFGAAAVFWAANITQEQAEFFFSQPKGLGLSLLRVSAKSYQENNGAFTTVPTYCPELETAKKAQALGARVWAASWTPPPAWKTNGAANGQSAARLQANHYADFAQSLATFATSMEAEGVPLYGISFQNEPDHQASWEGCMWSPQEMTTFIRDHFGPKLAAASPTTGIIAPDTASWGNLPGYVNAMVADSTAKGYIKVVATHPYGGGNLMYSAPHDNGKEFWETEISQERFPTDTPDPSMTSAITMLRMMHDHLTVANMNAWHWWALIHTENPITDPARQNPALIQAGVTFKRAYALGNFAKFVRPGMVRIAATASPATDILVSAYRDDAQFAIVAVNAGSQPRNQKFWLDGAQLGQVVPWITSDSLSLAKQAALTGTDNFSYSLPAKSVVTFVNWAADSPYTPPGDGGTGGQGGSAASAGASGLGGGGGGGGGAGAGAGGGAGAGAGAGGSSGVTGGAAGAPSASGTGGAIAAGGSSTTSAGGAGLPSGSGGGAPVTTAASPQTAADAGCGCRVSPAGESSGGGAWLALVGLTAAWRRRIRRLA